MPSSRHYHNYNSNDDGDDGDGGGDGGGGYDAGGDVHMMMMMRSRYTGHHSRSVTDSTQWRHRGMGSIRRQLEEFLESRPDAEELLSRHILHSINVAPCLLQKSEQIMWQSRMRLLQKKIRYRPKRSELLERGIVRGMNDTDRSEFLHLVAGLESKLSRRPGRVELVSKHILLQHHDVNPHIQSLQQMILSSRGDTVSDEGKEI